MLILSGIEYNIDGLELVQSNTNTSLFLICASSVVLELIRQSVEKKERFSEFEYNNFTGCDCFFHIEKGNYYLNVHFLEQLKAL